MTTQRSFSNVRSRALRRTVRPRLSASACSLRFESLENRRVLAAETISVGPGDNSMLLRVSSTNPTQIEFVLNGSVTNSYALPSLTSLTVNGNTGTDMLDVSYTNGNPIPAGGLVFNGQSGVGDTLRVVDGSFQDIIKTFSNTTDGSVQLVALGGLTSRTISYTGLSPVLLNVGSVANVVFNLPPVNNPGVLVGDDLAAVANTSQIRGTTFENTSFTNPSGSLTINLSNAGNSLTLLDMDPAYPATANITVNGGDRGDTIIGNSLNNRLFGGRGNDVIVGAGGDDLMVGGLGDDRYLLDTDLALGSDTINELDGGNDTLDFSSTITRRVSVNLSLATPQVVNAGLTLTLSSSTSVENIVGGSLGDSLTGNTLANLLTGRGGDDLLVGGTNNDTYIFDADLALGTDRIIDSAGIDTLDFSATTTRNVSVNLELAGVQVINAGLSLRLSSSLTLENVIGGSLNDVILGNSRDNRLEGGPGDDTLNGSSGNDTYVFDTDSALGFDSVEDEAGGFDTLDFSGTSTRPLVVNLLDGAPQVVNEGLTLLLFSSLRMEKVIGGSLGDRIVGNWLDNILMGMGGDDIISGGQGRDLIIGGTGADTIDGNSGDDLLIPGTTRHDGNSNSLRIILSEWASNKPYLERIGNLRSGILNVRLQASGVGRTVFNDAAVDTLLGSTGDDWYFRAAADQFGQFTPGEIVDLLVTS